MKLLYIRFSSVQFSPIGYMRGVDSLYMTGLGTLRFPFCLATADAIVVILLLCYLVGLRLAVGEWEAFDDSVLCANCDCGNGVSINISIFFCSI